MTRPLDHPMMADMSNLNSASTMMDSFRSYICGIRVTSAVAYNVSCWFKVKAVESRGERIADRDDAIGGVLLRDVVLL
mgnify:CR=1 FL=1